MRRLISIIDGMNGAIQAKTVTYDFERLMEEATLDSCSAFGEAVARKCERFEGGESLPWAGFLSPQVCPTVPASFRDTED